jgi:tetratricopeptide (TPR) repeat protein
LPDPYAALNAKPEVQAPSIAADPLSTPTDKSLAKSMSLPATPSEQTGSPAIPDLAPAPTPATSSAASKPSSEEVRRGMEAVRRRAATHLKRGLELAERRAFYAARAEFIRALRLLAQGLDASEGTTRRSDALASGLSAMHEAEDFIPRGAGLNADIDVERLAAVHRTKALRAESGAATPLKALQAYYTYAQQQLADAVKPSPEGSQILSALGKLHTEMDKEPSALLIDGRTKGLVCQQAALLADANNAKAANELGVLLAREGRYEESRAWLRHSVGIAPLGETWHNLSVVHHQLGERQLAEAARQRSLALAPRDGAGRPVAANAAPRLEVQRVSPSEFAGQKIPVNSEKTPARTARSPAADPEKTSGLWQWLPWTR